MNSRQCFYASVITILIVVTTIQLYSIYSASQKVHDAVLETEMVKMELAYLQGKYQEKYGFIKTDRGEILVRLISIDGGKNWVEITQSREIKQPAYWHQRYPDNEIAELRILEDQRN